MIWLSHINWLTHPRNPADKISYEEAVKIAKPASFDEVENWMKGPRQLFYNDEDFIHLQPGCFLTGSGNSQVNGQKKPRICDGVRKDNKTKF